MGISTKVEISGAHDWVVELVGLEPTTRLLRNAVRARPALDNGIWVSAEGRSIDTATDGFSGGPRHTTPGRITKRGPFDRIVMPITAAANPSP